MSLQQLISSHVLFQLGFHSQFYKNWFHESAIWILESIETLDRPQYPTLSLFESGASAYGVFLHTKNLFSLPVVQIWEIKNAVQWQ